METNFDSFLKEILCSIKEQVKKRKLFDILLEIIKLLNFSDTHTRVAARFLILILIIVTITLGVVISRLYENTDSRRYLGIGAIASNGEGCAEVGG